MLNNKDKGLFKLPVESIHPDGWLKSQLELINTLQKRLAALPGLLNNGEWTEGVSLPRFVRGLVLLGGALNDKAIKEKALVYMSAIMASASDGGDFGPKKYRSVIPQIEAIKAISAIYEQTGEKKYLHFLKKFFKNQFNTFSVFPNWYNSRARLLEEIAAIELVYRETDLEWLKDLSEKLRDNSNDWFKLADKFTYKHSANRYIPPSKMKRLKKKLDLYEPLDGAQKDRKEFTHAFAEKEWNKKTHRSAVELDGVNLAKALKYPVTYGRLIGDENLKNLSLKLLNSLMKYHGTPLGMFSCDRHLAGNSPTSGIDVEAAVETIESLTEILAETGDQYCADLIEQIVFNLIPSAYLDAAAAVSDSVMVNQVEACEEKRHPACEQEFGTAFISKKLSRGAISLLQAYPLFMRSLCMTRNGELNFMTYAPCTIDTTVNGANIVLREETGYPFRNSIVYFVDKAEGEPEVKINFRVPGGTTMQLISGGQVVASGTKNISVKCTLRTGSTFMLKLDIPLRAVDTSDKTVCLMKGSVLMSAKTPYKILLTEDRRIYNAVNLKKWGFAPVLAKKTPIGWRKPYESERTEVNAIGDKPYNLEKPPFELFIRSKNVINWDFDSYGLTRVPNAPIFSEESLERAFVPFGCAPLHVAQFPKCLK